MKPRRLFLLLLIMSSTTIAAFSQWTIQNALPEGKFLYTMTFTDVNTGYGVSDSGIIIKTTNGGLTWSKLARSTYFNLYGVCFTNDSTGYAVGGDYGSGILLKTVDGGANWFTRVQGTNAKGLQDVFFSDASTGFAVSVNSAMLKTTDGGNTWTPNGLGWLSSVFFTDNNTGYGTRDAGRLYKTTDGGATWSTLASGTTQDLNAAFFTDPATGYVVGASGTIIKTTDGGSTWTPLQSGTAATLIACKFTSPSTGYITGTLGTILKTTNSGASWITLPSGTNAVLSSISFPGGSTGYVSGAGGIILKTTNGGTFVTVHGPANASFSIFPDPASDHVTIVAGRNLAGETVIDILSAGGDPVLGPVVMNGNRMDLDVSLLKSGLYFTRIRDANGIEIKKLVIHTMP